MTEARSIPELLTRDLETLADAVRAGVTWSRPAMAETDTEEARAYADALDWLRSAVATAESVPESPSLTRETVEAAYRLLLDRAPDSEAAIRSGIGYGTRTRLRHAIITSNEYRRKNPLSIKLNNLPLNLPRLQIQADLDDADCARLFAHIKAKWTRLGQERPHWSVLSNPLYEGEVSPEAEEQFYRTGANELAEVEALLTRAGHAFAHFSNMVEYGCGLGRMTLQFARVVPRVSGLDISTTHLDLAAATAAQTGVENVAFKTASLPDFGMSDGFDFWYSRIVLQHNPPPLIKAILSRALSMLRPGGVAIFQVPTHAVNYSFELASYLRSRAGAGDIEMHCLPQREVLDVVAETGCRPCEIREDRSVDIPQYWISNTFVVEKAIAV